MANDPFNSRSGDWDEALNLVQSLIAARWRVMEDARSDAVAGEDGVLRNREHGESTEAALDYQLDIKRASEALHRAQPDLMEAEIVPSIGTVRRSAWPLVLVIWTVTLALVGTIAWAMTRLV